MTSNNNGRILWEGPSAIDGRPIVAIVTGLASSSANTKTGDMLQTFILRADVSPIAAVRSGEDFSICGTCPHRGPFETRSCYVTVAHAPLAVWKAYQRGSYAKAAGCDELRHLGAGRFVRLGTYGDPAAVPARVWRALVAGAAGHTGYTHQWQYASGRQLKDLCMASVETPAEAKLAQAYGWRTFRVAPPGTVKGERGEALCPASEQAGRKLTCQQCGACGGMDGRKASIWIPAHGAGAGKVTANLIARG